MDNILVILSVLTSILVGWLARSYVASQFMGEFHSLHNAGHSVEDSVERANKHALEKQKYVAWGLGLFIFSFVSVILIYISSQSSNKQFQNSIADADKNPAATAQGVGDAMKDLGFSPKADKKKSGN